VERRQTAQDERSPSARNLVLVFLASVAVCAVFFSLGFLIGYNQRESKQMPVSENVSGTSEIPPPVNAPVQSSSPASDAAGSAAAAPSAPAAAPPPVTPQTVRPTPAETEPRVKPAKRHASKPARTAAPANPVSAEGRTYSTGYSVQVMAARTEADANSLKNVLKSRGYQAFVLSPQAVGANDNYFRVLVGPFTDRASALKTRDKLEKEGFKPFIKH
jgi:cell division septation protein DedD